MKKTFLPLLLALVLPASASAGVVGTDPSENLVVCESPPCSTPIGAVPGGGTITAFTGNFANDSYVMIELYRDGGFVDSSPAFSTGEGVQRFETELRVPDGEGHTIALTVYNGAAAPEAFVEYTDPEVVRPEPTAEPTAAPTSTPQPEEAKSFTIEPRSVLDSGGRTVGVYARNDLGVTVSGKLTLKVGKQTFTKEIDEFEYHSSEDFYVPIAGKAKKKLMKKGALSGTVTAKTDGGTFTQTVKVVRGGAKGFDGTYRGDGPLVIVVKRGVIHTLSQNLNLFCPRSNTNFNRLASQVSGHPAVIAKDGSFSVRDTRGYDTTHYKGKFSRAGSVTGYLSLFHTNVAIADGRLVAEDCYQASNFTAKR